MSIPSKKILLTGGAGIIGLNPDRRHEADLLFDRMHERIRDGKPGPARNVSRQSMAASRRKSRRHRYLLPSRGRQYSGALAVMGNAIVDRLFENHKFTMTPAGRPDPQQP